MSGGKDAPDVPQLPPAPEAFKFGSFKDLTSDREVVQTTGIDGKEHLVQKSIEPQDPIIKSFLNEAKRSIGGLIREISVVSKENPRLVAPFHGFINQLTSLNDQDLADWTDTVRPEAFAALKNDLIQTNTFLNNESWDNYDHQLEVSLAARGLSNSTVANERRSLAARERRVSNDIIRNNAEMTADQMINSDFGRKQIIFEGRRTGRQGAMSIAEQQYALEQQGVDRTLIDRDARMDRLSKVIGLNQGVINQDIEENQAKNILPTVLGAQNAITGQQNSVWAQKTQNELSKYQAQTQQYAADQALTGNLISGLTTAATLVAAPYLLPAVAPAAVSGGAAGAAASGLTRRNR